MRKHVILLAGAMLLASSCQRQRPAPWDGPVLTEPRAQLTVEELTTDAPAPFLDMSFFARPAWAKDSAVPFSGRIAFDEAAMVAPKDREAYEGEDLFPAIEVAFISHKQALVPRVKQAIDTRPLGESYWDIILGTGAIWREDGDGEWSRASFPISMLGRYVGEVRNCVAMFVYKADAMSNVSLQCSQETAVFDAQQLGDVRAMIPATYSPEEFEDADAFLQAHEEWEARRIPTKPLTDIDSDGEIAEHFDVTFHTNASTSMGAIYKDGTLYVHPPNTRHGTYPYPDAMRHGVFSVTKSMAGALAMFYFAERYGEEIFDEPIADHVPAFQGLPEWQGVTFSHALNMVTGTRAGEDLLYEPLELAPDKEAAINNIAAFGDFPEAPGEAFNYATTNTFVLSYALENYVRAKEGEDVHYWELVRDNVLKPIGAEDFGVLLTRDEDPLARVPILGLGGYPTLDNAAKIARLIANEGEHDGEQLLNRNKIREALGRTEWEGHRAFERMRYSHSFWSKKVRVGFCRVHLFFMEGLGDNRVIFFPSGVISFQFTDEFDDDFKRLVRAVEGMESSCD
jgi:hypothetical protein